MAEALDPHEPVAAPAAAAADKFPLNDLPNDLLVSVFEAVGDLFWVRHTVPLVCKAWADLYRSQNASPLHETLEVDFEKEKAAAREGRRRAAAQERPLRRPVVHASRIISWTERRAGWVRKLRLLEGAFFEVTKPAAFEVISPEDLGRLVAVAASSLTEIRIGYNSKDAAAFWEALSGSVVRAGRLRSLVVHGNIADASESDVEPLGQLAGSLEELELTALSRDRNGFPREGSRLARFPESFCTLTELRRLKLRGHQRITAIPAQISSLKKLKELKLCYCGLRAVPAFFGELESLELLDLSENENFEDTPQDEAFPAALGRMKSLRVLNLSDCGLRAAVPAFVGELDSLEILNLSYSYLGKAPEDEAFPAGLGRMKSLRELDLRCCDLCAVPAFVGELEALEVLHLSKNEDLGTAPQDEAFPATLGRMKSLRVLSLEDCGLRTVPAFVGELESLEALDLSWNEPQIYATLGVLIEGCPHLREVVLPWSSSRAHLEAFGAFEAKLLAKNPNAKVFSE